MKKINAFSFTVKYLGFLKHIPLLALLFDNLLRLWTLMTAPQILDCIDDIEATVSGWPGTTNTMHKYGGMQLNYNGRELGHIHSNGMLDIRFSRKIKQQLISGGRINDHHVFENSGWITFYIRNRDDHQYATELLRMVYLKVGR